MSLHGRGSKTVRRGIGARVSRLAKGASSGGIGKTVSKIAKRRGARKRKNK